MKLIELNEKHFNTMLSIHDNNGGNLINQSLSKLFECMHDDSNKFEVSIKVAALNQIYSTAIQYIAPVVEKIVCEIPNDYTSLTNAQYVALVDNIATVKWVSPTTRKEHSRCNLSFSSKYIHFLSQRKIPIYDSYIWIVMIGYLKQYSKVKYSFSPPVNYEKFFNIFIEFKKIFKLEKRSNYETDKFLWQYAKNMLDDIIKKERVRPVPAKSLLKKRITSACTLGLDNSDYIREA